MKVLNINRDSFTSYINLLTAWATRSIRVRYQQSILGGLWAVLQPAATVAIFTVIFSYFIRVDTGEIPYVLFAYAAMVPWTLFSTSVTEMVESLVTNMNLVTKIYFPREILPMAALLARVVDFLIASVVFLFLMVYFGFPIFTPSWLALPLIFLVQVSLALGIGLMGAALNVFFRDVRHLIILILQIWLYATPIIYPVSMVPAWLRPFYFLNPMAGVIEAYRGVFFYGKVPDTVLMVAGIISLIILAVGFVFFKRLEFQFADVV